MGQLLEHAQALLDLLKQEYGVDVALILCDQQGYNPGLTYERAVQVADAVAADLGCDYGHDFDPEHKPGEVVVDRVRLHAGPFISFTLSGVRSEPLGEWRTWKPDTAVGKGSYVANYHPRGACYATRSGERASWAEAIENARPIESEAK